MTEKEEYFDKVINVILDYDYAIKFDVLDYTQGREKAFLKIKTLVWEFLAKNDSSKQTITETEK